MKRKILFVLTFFSFSLSVLSQTFILGGSGEGELIMPRTVKEGPDGKIYALDVRDGFIKVYSADGKFLKKIAGKGEGPGEIKRTDGANFGFTSDGKSIFITEFFGGHSWITLVDLEGKFKKAIHLKFNRFFGVVGAESLADGTFLVYVMFFEQPKQVEDYFHYILSNVLFRINENGEIIQEILKRSYVHTISLSPGGGDIGQIPFIPRFSCVPWKGKGVIFTDGLSRKFSIFDFSGNKIGEILTPLPEPENVTSKDLEKWREERREVLSRNSEWYGRFGRVIEKYKKSIYEKKPNLDWMILTPEENILVKAPEGEIYYLLNDKGKLLCTVKSKYSIRNITKNFLFLSRTDEEGFERVYCMKRKGSEAKDLKNIEKI